MHMLDTCKSNQIFHYTRCILPKRVTRLASPSPFHCARATQLLSKKCSSRVASRWQHYVRFERPEIWTSHLPLQKRTRYRSTNWPIPVIVYKCLNALQILNMYSILHKRDMPFLSFFICYKSFLKQPNQDDLNLNLFTSNLEKFSSCCGKRKFSILRFAEAPLRKFGHFWPTFNLNDALKHRNVITLTYAI